MKTHFSAALRFYVSCSIMVTAVVAARDPWSQHRMAMSEDGFGGLIGIAILGGLALAGIVDVVINDFLPKRFSIECTHRQRHLVFACMAMGQVALVLAVVKALDLKPSVARYLLDATMAAWLAWVGVRDHWMTENQKREARISERAEL